MFQGTVGGPKVKGSIFLLFSVFLNVRLTVILVLRANRTTGPMGMCYYAVGPTGTTWYYQVPQYRWLVPYFYYLVPAKIMFWNQEFSFCGRPTGFVQGLFWTTSSKPCPFQNRFLQQKTCVWKWKHMQQSSMNKTTLIGKKLGLNLGFWWRYVRSYMIVIRENEVVQNSF